MDLLSVVVPVYNSEKYIGRCVESILAQTYSNLEIILVDDGPSDLSGRVCDGYAEKNKNIIAIHQSNEGVTKARLEGARRSKGKYITFVDSDDWIEECFYERMLEDDENYELIISGIYRFYDEKTCRKELSLCSGIYYKDRILNEVIPCMMWDFHKNMWVLDPSLCTKIFRRQLLINELEKIIEVGSHYGDDSMTLYPMMFHIEKLKAVNEAFYYHWQRAKGKFPYYIEDELFLEKLHFV
jgi:glycosyltransferase involved in cell wall biosynthesis